MFHRASAAVMCGLLATTLVAGTAPATSAGDERPSRVVLRDGPGDVWKFDLKTEEAVRLESFPRADVTRAVVAHRPAALIVRMRFVDLRRVGVQLYWVDIRTRFNYFQAIVSSKPGNRRGKRSFEGDDGSKSCEGFTRKIDYIDDLVTMRIPRTCLVNPRWVRVGVYNQLSFNESGPNYWDSPFDHEFDAGGGTGRLYVMQP